MVTKLFRGDFWYQVLYKLKSGISIGVALTFKCNLDCYYCNMKIPNGKPRNAKEVGFDDWAFMIKTFPGRLKEVYISGGEPTLMPYCAELVNFITKRKILVTVFTNLTRPDVIRKMKPTSYLRIEASLHPPEDVGTFRLRYIWLKMRGYQIIIDEVQQQRMQGSNVKPMQTDVSELINGRDRLRFAPDMKMSLNCYDYYNA